MHIEEGQCVAALQSHAPAPPRSCVQFSAVSHPHEPLSYVLVDFRRLVLVKPLAQVAEAMGRVLPAVLHAVMPLPCKVFIVRSVVAVEVL